MKKKILLLFILSISITTNIGTNGSVSQGVQQSLEIFVLSNKDFKELNLNAFTYPNPTKDKITLELSNLELTNLTFTMFDIKGRTLLKGVIKEKNTSIIMKDYSAGVYLLKVHQQNKELKTFKIIKK